MSPEVYKSPEVGQEVPTPGVDASQLHEPDGPQALGQSVRLQTYLVAQNQSQ